MRLIEVGSGSPRLFSSRMSWPSGRSRGLGGLPPPRLGKRGSENGVTDLQRRASAKIEISESKFSPPSPVSTILASGLFPERKMVRSEEHTSELQSQSNLVCRLLLEKKKKINKNIY